MLIPYGTDSNAFRPKGAKSYGIFPAILPADVVSQMHGDAEHMPLGGRARRGRGAVRRAEGRAEALNPAPTPSTRWIV